MKCPDCHSAIEASFAQTTMYDYGVECKDCHMPFATKSAQPTGALTMFVSFYTYDSLGNQVWLVANGPAPSGTSITLNVQMTDGAMWGADFDTADVNRIDWGTATFTFPTCTAGSVSLVPNQAMVDEGYSDLAYDLTRDILESGIQCPTFVNNAP